MCRTEDSSSQPFTKWGPSNLSRISATSNSHRYDPLDERCQYFPLRGNVSRCQPGASLLHLPLQLLPLPILERIVKRLRRAERLPGRSSASRMGGTSATADAMMGMTASSTNPDYSWRR